MRRSRPFSHSENLTLLIRVLDWTVDPWGTDASRHGGLEVPREFAELVGRTAVTERVTRCRGRGAIEEGAFPFDRELTCTRGCRAKIRRRNGPVCMSASPRMLRLQLRLSVRPSVAPRVCYAGLAPAISSYTTLVSRCVATQVASVTEPPRKLFKKTQ